MRKIIAIHKANVEEKNDLEEVVVETQVVVDPIQDLDEIVPDSVWTEYMIKPGQTLFNIPLLVTATMTGTNRLTILPTGWVHSQDNTKTVLSSVGTIDDAKPAVAREFGVNRYERIVGFDFSEAERYWSATSGYWKRVRKAWDKHTGQADRVRVDDKCNDTPVYALLFEVANEVDSKTGLKKADELKRVEDILSCSVSAPQ